MICENIYNFSPTLPSHESEAQILIYIMIIDLIAHIEQTDMYRDP